MQRGVKSSEQKKNRKKTKSATAWKRQQNSSEQSR